MDKLLEDVVNYRLLWKAGELFHVDDCFIEPFLSELLESVKRIITSPGYEITVNDQNVAEICLARSIMVIRSGNDKQRFEEKFVEILCCCLKFPLCSVDSKITPHAKIASDILSYFYLSYSNLPTLSGFLDTVTKFLLCGNPVIIENLTCFFHLVVENNVGCFSKHVDIILQSILQCDNFSLIPILLHLHVVDVAKHITKNLNQLLNSSYKSRSNAVKEAILKLITIIYKDDPQVVEECLRKIIDFLNYPSLVRMTINILNKIFWSNQKIFQYYITGLMQIGLAARTQDFDLIGSLLVSICSTDEMLAKDCLVYLTACLFHKTANVTIIFAWIESLLPKYLCHLKMMLEVISHLENESEVSEFSLSLISKLKMIVTGSFTQNSLAIQMTPPAREQIDSTPTKSVIAGSAGHLHCNSGKMPNAEDGSVVSDAEHSVSLHLKVYDNSSSNNTSLVRELYDNNPKLIETKEKTNQSVEGLDQDEKKSILRNMMVREQCNGSMLNIRDRNQNYFGDLNMLAQTKELRNCSEASDTSSSKAELGIGINDFGQRKGKHLKCIESVEATGSIYFENVGYQSSQTSMYDELIEEQFLKKYLANESLTKIDGSFCDETLNDKKSNCCERTSATCLSMESKRETPVAIWKDGSQDEDLKSSKPCVDASIRTSLMLLESRCSKPTLAPDSLELYCNAHKQEIMDSIKNLLMKTPIPSNILISRIQNYKQKFVLEFCCPSKDRRCAFGNSHSFHLDSKHIETWLHIMFLKVSTEDGSSCLENLDLSKRDQFVSENDSTNQSLAACCPKHVEQLKMKKRIIYVWSSIETREKSFVKSIISGFPNEKKIQKAIQELQERRYFDLFSRNEGSEEWLCFVCKNTRHNPSFIKSDGSLNVESLVKRKSGSMKFLKSWKFTRFVIDGFRLSYIRNDQSVHLEEITKVKAKEHCMLMSKYTTISLTAVKGKFPSLAQYSDGDCIRTRKKKLTLRFFDQNEAKVWIRCLCIIMARFRDVSDNLGMYLHPE